MRGPHGAMLGAAAILSLASVSMVAGQGSKPAAKTPPPVKKTTAAAPAPAPAKSASSKNARKWTPSARTPDGQPDLQGVYTFASLTPMERPASAGGKAELTPEEVAAIEKRAADNALKDNDRRRPGDPGTYNRFWGGGQEAKATTRTSLIVDPPDGRLPPLTEKAKKLGIAQNRLSRLDFGPADSWLDRDPYERCIAREVPRTGGNNPGAQIVQTPGYVTIVYEAMHDTRVIPLDGRPHVGAHIRLWNGDSRGRWEGNTLVVDTTNFSDSQTFFGAPAGQMHLTERFTRVDADTISYEATINDPATWTRPWTFILPWYHSDDYEEIFEYACHEGNYNSMSGILGGAREKERQAAEAAAKGKK